MIENVRRGRDWLNQNQPGWFERIDIQKLDMDNVVGCICGQLGIDNLPAVSENTLDDYDRLSFDIGLGFAVARYEDDYDIDAHRWEELRSLWITEIETLLYPPNSGALTSEATAV